jgi:predicted RNA binding protein YcfA (HicA-like mRNA interferase family)
VTGDRDEPLRLGAGSHEVWRNPSTRKQTTIPYHSAKDIGPGLLSGVLKQLGINRETFDAQ